MPEKLKNIPPKKLARYAVIVILIAAILCIYISTLTTKGSDPREEAAQPDLEERLTAALESYQEKPQLIIVCGAQGINEPRAEGDVMRDWLIEKGVRPEDVVAETASFNTRENLVYARAIMEHRGLSQALIVTSDYHVARALALCRQTGIAATGKGSPSKPEYFIKNHFREGLSWIKLWLESR